MLHYQTNKQTNSKIIPKTERPFIVLLFFVFFLMVLDPICTPNPCVQQADLLLSLPYDFDAFL